MKETTTRISPNTYEQKVLDRILELQALFPLIEVPVWAITARQDFQLNALLYSHGCDEVLLAQDFPDVFHNIPKQEYDLGSSNKSMIKLWGATQGSDSTWTMSQREQFIANSGKRRAIIESCTNSDNLAQMLEKIIDALFISQSPHLIVVLVNNNQSVESYFRPSELIFREDYADFLSFCLTDFHSFFSGVNLEDIQEYAMLNGRSDFEKISIEAHRMSSYVYFPIYGPNATVSATIHLGHLRNNYFSERTMRSIRTMVEDVSGRFYYALRLQQNTFKQEKLLNIFSRFVPMDIIPGLIMRESVKLHSQAGRKNIAVLFSDIRSFTTITESNNAQSVVEFLNRHFEVMVGAIKKNGGVIDKFIGDAIVAMFGSEDGAQAEDSCTSAILAAIEMDSLLPTVDCSNLKLEGGTYSIGIGVHYGPAIVGNIGSPEKTEYTAIGEVTGIAEELEALTKSYPGRILISGKAAELSRLEGELKLTDTIEMGEQGIMSLFIPAGNADV